MNPFFLKPIAVVAVLSFTSIANASVILVDDFSEASHSWYSAADAWINPGSMLGGYRRTDAFGGLTASTFNGAQTGISWRDRGSNTGNSWGLATVGDQVVELNLNFGPSGYIAVDFLDVSPGLQLWAVVASYVSGSGYGTRTQAWESPKYTLSAGAQVDRLYLSDFLPGPGGALVEYDDIDALGIWITQPVGVYPPLGSPAYVLDSVYAVTSESDGKTVDEPASIALVLTGICASWLRRRRDKRSTRK
jgi:hypothetical protein